MVELGIAVSPALIFYWDGVPLTIRRPEWDDDIKYAGSITKEGLLDLIRAVKDAALRGSKMIHCDS